jgi:hypothetical protein
VCCGDIATWLSPQQTLWLCLHNKHCGYVSTTNIVAMSPQQTLWLSPHQTLWLCLVVETKPQCLLWRHSHNVCCGDMATMFVAGTTNIIVFFLVLSLQSMMGYVSTSNIAAMSPHQTLRLCLHNKHCGHNVCCGDIATMFVVET